MKKNVLALVIVSLVAAYMMGCATTGTATISYPSLGPVPPPSPGHILKINNLLILSDISKSMRKEGKIGIEKRVLRSFNGGIPTGLKYGGLRTFGESAYYDTVLVRPLDGYDRAAFANIIEELEAGRGPTPLANALVRAQDDLKDAQGNIAILVVSDGQSLSRNLTESAIALQELYETRLCIHTIHIGESDTGREILREIATQSGCGLAITAAELQSENSMRKFIANVFYKQESSDSDGDGVFDVYDRCPATPKGIKVDKTGCPLDSDGDGVLDHKDRCPGTPEGVRVDKNGCPLDSDGDGVPDYKDECPETPKGSRINSAGCWTLKGVYFDFNKWDIKPQYYSVLDKAVRVLESNPTLKIEVRGHTDSTASEEYNQALSERRAKSVKDYFISKGISADMISTRGLGELEPLATNDTVEGRAKNRRMWIRIISR